MTYQNNLPSRGNRGGHILDVDECAHGPNYFSDAPLIVTHLHGGHVPARVDGQPEYTILPGEFDVYEYPNNQDAATVWYHDHALGITRLNVYSGLAGFYLIADAEDTLGPDNAFGLPSGQYEIGLAIQDRESTRSDWRTLPTRVTIPSSGWSEPTSGLLMLPLTWAAASAAS